MFVDEAKANFEQYKANRETYREIDLNESDTRSKLLDEMFKSVLGWSEGDIDREGHTLEGYYDYRFSIPNFKFLVEAKRSFVQFTLPTKHRVVTFGTLLKENSAVIKQIRGYLVEESLQYGIITNGNQFIVGRFLNSDGTDWKSNKCLIFDSIDDINDRFIEFYNCLSKKAILENSGFDFLREDTIRGQTVLANIPSKDSELIRNSLSSSLKPIINSLFGEIYKYDQLDDKTLIEKCFVENDEIKKNKSEIERLFADKPPVLDNVIPIRNTRNLAKEIQNEMGEDWISIKNSEVPKPIIIVGSKGAGKTTFLNYLFKLSFNEDFLKARPHIHIDFRYYTESDLQDIDNKVIKDALDNLYETYASYNLYTNSVLKRIYIEDIKKKDASTWEWNKNNNEEKYNEVLNEFLEERQKDLQNHFIRLSEYLLRERRLRLCLIIDNADQFDQEVQRKAFFFAQSINRKAKCAVILSLREGYYYKWRNMPPFDAFQSNVYHVTAPPYKDVLQKRIDYALEQLEIKGTTSGSVGTGLKVSLDNAKVKNFFLSARHSLFIRKNSEILEFLQETTYPNIREGLLLFEKFLLSGHADIGEYILRQQSSLGATNNPVPIWEFVKAVALENKKYYNHNISKVVNVFFPVEGSVSHFIKLKILNYLRIQIDNLGFKEKYISVQQIIDDFTSINYKPNIIMAELNELLSYNLVETDDNSSDRDPSFKLNPNNFLSISLKGNYYIKVLVGSFTYIDLVLQDTPLFSDEYYSSIKQAFPLSEDNGKRNLDKRAQTVVEFINYLLLREEKETFENSVIPMNIMKNMLVNGLSVEIRTISKANIIWESGLTI